jgi:cytochrome c oxidase assembly protein subunit 15
MPSASTPAGRSAWPHRWALLLACATFPLIWWGGFVTATGSGMAFRDWLTSDGVFMPAYPWLSSAGSKFIEHGHRLLAMATGVLTIVMVAALWRAESRRWVRWYGVGLLAAVIFQGILGGQRVLLDASAPDQARVVALIHGCTGPLFFAACVALVVVTSRQWGSASLESSPAGRKLFRLAILTTTLAYMQIVVGAVVRHSPLLLADGAGAMFQAAVYFHLLLAGAIVVHVLLLAFRCWRDRLHRPLAIGLGSLIVMQLLLGASSWVVKYGMPSWFTRLIGETGHFNRATDLASAAILAAHGAVGSLIFALSLVIAMAAGRRLGIATPVLTLAAARSAGGLA